MVYPFDSEDQIVYVVEKANWSIYWDGKSITKHLKDIKTAINTDTWSYRNKIIHLGSLNLISKIFETHSSNRIILTIFHIAPNNDKVELLLNNLTKIDLIHTSCKITRDKLIRLGVPAKK